MEYLRLIQAIANEEIADISLYGKESELFSKKIIGGDRIAEKFKKFSREEEAHFGALSEITGGKLELKRREIKPSSSLRKTLRMHLQREADSVRFYENLLNFVEDEPSGKTIKRTIEQEKKHYDTIKRYLLLIG